VRVFCVIRSYQSPRHFRNCPAGPGAGRIQPLEIVPNATRDGLMSHGRIDFAPVQVGRETIGRSSAAMRAPHMQRVEADPHPLFPGAAPDKPPLN